MCVHIRRATRVTSPWDANHATITIPAQLPRERAILAVRAVLADLAVEQPEFGAICWCGTPVLLAGAPLVPQQRQQNEVIARGA